MDKASKGRSGKIPATNSAGALAGASGDKRLLELVEAEIIPRLMLAHRNQNETAQVTSTIRASEVETFVRALLERSREPAASLLAGYIERSVPLEAIFLQLFAPAARYLGELWEADLCNFSQVTLSLWRLQSLLHDLSPSFHANPATGRNRAGAERRILLCTLPGQQHTFGLSMLSEFFRRDGWVVLTIPAPEPGEMLGTLSKHWFDVLAMSASLDGETSDLRKTIQAARKTSQNPRLAVIVGGPLFLRQPALADAVGADGMSDDAPGALALAARLLQAQQEVRLN